MAISSSDNCCLEPNCLNDDIQLIAVIDDLLMKALSSARHEADSLRIQQQKQIRELDDLKRDIQSLRRTGHELNASDDKLLVENRNIKEQVILLQERLQKAHSDECTRAAELLAAKREIEELQQKSFITSRQTAELASLHIAIKNKDKQEEQHKQELAVARLQAETAIKANTESLKRLESLELIHSALASDHDRLQNLHQMLSSDYDRVITLQKKLKGEKSLNEQTLKADFLRERSNLELELEKERTERQREVRKVSELEIELDRVNRELNELKRDQNSIANRSDTCLDELRRLRISECAQKSTICNLNVIIQQLNNALTEKDLELANLRRQVEMLRQYTGDENRTLIHAFYNEQKELQEKLQHLRRHKEKLEEKIMEQYKAMDSRKLERPTFMKRAAKALIAKAKENI
uniref:Uncharacterized protein n=1 Tax=Meloidogyne enterolobii TaxID=390850 RepID=A0A6V7XMR0_MELEN|nr:unnamed protein product [Meloidogyne enterolobii]